MEDNLFKMECIVITGGSGFLGSYFCKKFSKDYKIICIDINFKNKLSGKKIEKINCDISSLSEIKKKLDHLKKFRKIHLVNNAAVDSVPASGKEISLEDNLTKQMMVSFLGTKNITEFVGGIMCKRKFGSIINIGSDLSVIAPNQEIYNGVYKNFVKSLDYSVAKHGLVGLTKYYASLFAKFNIRVNMVSPAPIKNKQKQQLIKNLLKIIPMRRLAKRDDIYYLLKFLLSKNSGYITGQNILIDGGRSII